MRTTLIPCALLCAALQTGCAVEPVDEASERSETALTPVLVEQPVPPTVQTGGDAHAVIDTVRAFAVHSNGTVAERTVEAIRRTLAISRTSRAYCYEALGTAYNRTACASYIYAHPSPTAWRWIESEDLHMSASNVGPILSTVRNFAHELLTASYAEYDTEVLDESTNDETHVALLFDPAATNMILVRFGRLGLDE